MSSVGKRPQRASASKAKSSVLSELSGLENVLFSEEDEIAALDAVGDFVADATVMLEDVPQDIVIKTLKVSGVCARARAVYMCY